MRYQKLLDTIIISNTPVRIDNLGITDIYVEVDLEGFLPYGDDKKILANSEDNEKALKEKGFILNMPYRVIGVKMTKNHPLHDKFYTLLLLVKGKEVEFKAYCFKEFERKPLTMKTK